jgi:hypothetical protein
VIDQLYNFCFHSRSLSSELQLTTDKDDVSVITGSRLRHVFLFNDALVITKKRGSRYSYKQVINRMSLSLTICSIMPLQSQMIQFGDMRVDFYPTGISNALKLWTSRSNSVWKWHCVAMCFHRFTLARFRYSYLSRSALLSCARYSRSF